jgi:hypothetical protein
MGILCNYHQNLHRKGCSNLQSNQRETIIYNPDIFKGPAYAQYKRELKRRQKDGWQLVSCTEAGPLLTAIYEKSGQAPTLSPTITEHLALLLPMLSSEERIRFEADVQAVIHQWLARKARGRG